MERKAHTPTPTPSSPTKGKYSAPPYMLRSRSSTLPASIFKGIQFIIVSLRHYLSILHIIGPDQTIKCFKCNKTVYKPEEKRFDDKRFHGMCFIVWKRVFFYYLNLYSLKNALHL